MTVKRKVQAFELERAGVVAVMLKAPAGDPPTELLLFAEGVTETTKGPMLFDKIAAAKVMTTFSEMGLDLLPFDVAHGMVNPMAPPDAHKAYGWFKPEVRDGALYATGIEWNELGSEALKKREFRFYSPAFMRERDSGRIVELINVALTNIPATKGQKPIVAHKSGDDPDTKGRTSMDLEEFLKMLGVRTAAEALSRNTEHTSLSSGLLSLTGKSTVAEALSTITSWKTQAAQSVELAAKVQALESAQTNGKRDATIERLSKDGKLVPALHAWAKTQSVEQLEAFAKDAPVVVPGGGEAAIKSGKEGDQVVLSAADVQVISQLGLDPKLFIEERKREIDRARLAGVQAGA